MYENDLLTAVISISASGDSTVIAAPTYGYLAIDHINFIPTSAVGVTLKSDTTSLTGTYPLDSKQAFTIENAFLNPKGVVTCASGEALIINLDSAVQLSGMIRYRIVI